jgi:hypothetical protein
MQWCTNFTCALMDPVTCQLLKHLVASATVAIHTLPGAADHAYVCKTSVAATGCRNQLLNHRQHPNLPLSQRQLLARTYQPDTSGSQRLLLALPGCLACCRLASLALACCLLGVSCQLL